MNKRLLVALAVVAALCVGVVIGFAAYGPSAKNSTSTTPKSQTDSSSNSKPAPSYHIGDTQKDGGLSITLTSAGGATSMAQLPPGDTVFEVNLSVTNNGRAAYTSNDAFVKLSSVYTQVGADTSTGKYNPAYSTPCFGGGSVTVQPGQTVKGCIEFIVPSNASVDTYFYDNLKWFLP